MATGRQIGPAWRDPSGMSSAQALGRAFDRLDDFVAVQRAAGGLSVEAVNLLQEAVGVLEAERALICDRAVAHGAGEETAAVLLGVLVGLFAAGEGA